MLRAVTALTCKVSGTQQASLLITVELVLFYFVLFVRSGPGLKTKSVPFIVYWLHVKIDWWHIYWLQVQSISYGGYINMCSHSTLGHLDASLLVTEFFLWTVCYAEGSTYRAALVHRRGPGRRPWSRAQTQSSASASSSLPWYSDRLKGCHFMALKRLMKTSNIH